jgi:AraC-like DNA-binding protein
MRVEQRDDGALVSGFLDIDPDRRAGALDTVLVRGSYPYRAEMRPYRFGSLNACDISGGDHQVTPEIRHNAYILGLLLTGRGTLEQDARLVPLAGGDFALYRADRPFRLELSGPYRFFVIDLGRGDTGYLRHAGPVVANPELSRFAGARILKTALPEIARLAAQMGPLTRQGMGEHIICMLRTLVQEASGCDPRAPDAILDRVLSHIDQHLDSELSPDSIASAHYISVRYLHALFERQGDTVGHHIRRRRLDRIRRDLTDRDLSYLPGYAIAARWGIPNPSHFSKLFRAEFGMSPREFRERQAASERIRQDPGLP